VSVPVILSKLKRRFRALRARSPLLDHTVRAYQRAGDLHWTQVAGSITYFGFLSLFPLLALVFAAVGVLSQIYPSVEDGVRTTITSAFPGLLGSGRNQISLDDIEGASRGAGIVGLLGLLWTGTSAVDAVRVGVRRIFETASEDISLPWKKFRDVLVMVALGVLLVASVAVSSVTTRATSILLRSVGLAGELPAEIVLRVLTLAVALGLNTALLAVLFRLVSGRELSWRQLRSGAFLGAVLLEVLKLLATRLIASAFTNPLYAGFAVVVALLLWINFSARVLVFAAAWVSTEASVLAAQPTVRAVGPSALPLIVDPDFQEPWARRGGPLAVAGVAALTVRALRRSRQRRPSSTSRS
jgi:membrane protein